jgi:hypothetical protein
MVCKLTKQEIEAALSAEIPHNRGWGEVDKDGRILL